MISVSTKWLEKTQSLSHEEHGLLVDLVLTAAQFESPTLPLTVEALQAMASGDDLGGHVIELFAELCRLDLVCEISPGLFEIAPGLWRLEKPDWKGEMAAWRDRILHKGDPLTTRRNDMACPCRHSLDEDRQSATRRLPQDQT
jgi:hypothetical protein